MEENESPQIYEGYSKVEITRNTKGINVTIKANGRDYLNLQNISDEAIRVFKDAESKLNPISQ